MACFHELYLSVFQVNDTNLENVTHEEAVASLKATQEVVRLLIAKPSFLADSLPPDSAPTPGQWSPVYRSVMEKISGIEILF